MSASAKTPPDLPVFLASLSSTKLDQLVRAVSHIRRLCSPDEMRVLEDQLASVRGQLDEVNERRDQLRAQKDDLLAVVGACAESLKSGSSGREVTDLRFACSELVADIDTRIAGTRPEELHAEKAALRRELERRRYFSGVVDMIQREAMTRGR